MVVVVVFTPCSSILKPQAARRSVAPRTANHFRGQCPLPYPVVPVLSRCVAWGVHPRRSVLVGVLPRSVLKGGAPRIISEVSARYRTRSSRFFPAVLLGACTPAVRSWSLCCRAPFSREAPRESFPRSVSATVPDRPGSLPLCCLGVVVFRPQGRSPANHF